MLKPAVLAQVMAYWWEQCRKARHVMQDWQGKLGKDPQKRADNKSLHERELRELFGMFIHNLRGQIQQGYRSLMDQVGPPSCPALCPDCYAFQGWNTEQLRSCAFSGLICSWHPFRTQQQCCC